MSLIDRHDGILRRFAGRGVHCNRFAKYHSVRFALASFNDRDQASDGVGSAPATDREVDVQQIVDRIRQKLRRDRPAGDASDAWAIFADGQLTDDIEGLYRTSDPAEVGFVSHRQILGGVVVGLKQTLRKLLTPILGRQAAYNAMNARVAGRLREHLAALVEQQRQTRRELEELRAAVEDMRRTARE